MTTASGSIRDPRARMHEHLGSLHDIVDTLQRELVACSIMTPWSEVDAVEGAGPTRQAQAAAGELMDRHHYSGVPLLAGGRVCGVYVRTEPRERPSFEPITPDHFVEPTLALVPLIQRMKESRKVVVGVGSAQAPEGWLTYADFSKRPFRVLLFAIVAEVEYLLAVAIDRAHPADAWVGLLPPDSQNQLLQQQGAAEQWDVTMPVTTFADIGQLIDAVGRSPEVQALLGVDDRIADRLRSLSQLRNRVAHVVRPIVSGPGRIRSVAKQVALMLGWIDSWTARLAGH